MKKLHNFGFLLSLLFLLSACGSEDFPRPDINHEFFVWHEVNATPSGQCFSVMGRVEGNVDNLKNIYLEIQELDENCPECAFIPEIRELYSVNEVLNPSNNQFSLTYCPLVKTPAYRYRVAGENVINGLPIVYSVPKQLQMPQF